MNYLDISYDYRNKPHLDPGFIPFGVWAKAFLEGAERPFKVALERDAGHISVFSSFLRGEEKDRVPPRPCGAAAPMDVVSRGL